ncbi:MAG: hypothetical protein A3H27_14960 [Acidobacteria bacterium RIFCSPLOWO2_02_FULL_59_13]|nr:MAG: hypothetical protein A3H27_14960 [Acidobacteria bacterium RIFCSPLOWO2_02_FULL_59_13]
MSAKDLLTFELGPDKDQLFIHGDAAGLRRLASLIGKLADAAQRGEYPHDHLMTEAWGGYGLSAEPQEQGGECLNHVKIYGWPDNRTANPRRGT